MLNGRKKKMIEELEMPYQDVGSGLVLDIPELVAKINEIIRYINEKEEENEGSNTQNRENRRSIGC